MSMAYLFIGFQMVDEVIHSVNALLYSEVKLMVNGAQLLSNLSGSYEVWSAFYSNAEGVKGMRPVKGILSFLKMPAASAAVVSKKFF